MKTTKKDFELFKKTCLEWQKKLYLDSWELFFVHEKATGARAAIRTETTNHQAVVVFATDWSKANIEPKTPEAIKKVAVHEMCHLLIGNLSNLGNSRYVSEDEINSAEEEVVRRLLKVLYGNSS